MKQLIARLRSIETVLDSVTFDMDYGPAMKLGQEAADTIEELVRENHRLTTSLEAYDWEANND